MTPSADRAPSFRHPWSFPVVSLLFVLLSLTMAFLFSSPTAGYFQWIGVVVTLIAAVGCVACFFLTPCRPIAPKLITCVLPALPLFLSILYGCATPPKLTAEDRRQDIEYMADWAKDYSPFVELNEKQKGIPSYETLKPTYVEFAEKATSNDDFFLVVCSCFGVVGATGHAYLVPEDSCKWSAVGQILGIFNWGISPSLWWASAYWSRLSNEVPTRAHPPFFVTAKEGCYYTDSDWIHNGIAIPSGSKIQSVNGMSCSSYLDYAKTKTHLRYEAFPKDWLDKYLLFINEGKDFRGWTVNFLLPEGGTVEAFVPKQTGIYIEKGAPLTTDAEENCTCLELTDSEGYIRIKIMMPNTLNYVFKGYIKKERAKIRKFFEQSQGKYKKLIIDVRNNGGGLPEHIYEVLTRPFLEKPITVKSIIGLKRKYLQDTKPSVLNDQKLIYEKFIFYTREVEPPNGFGGNEWIFYQIIRKISPSSKRYNFQGKLFVLINGRCYSATDDYADLVKRAGLGTLIGQNTGGCGGCYHSPPAIRLPRSGMIFRVETDLLLTPNGEINELVGTKPDVILPSADSPNSITREDLVKHPWIEAILLDRLLEDKLISMW